MNNLPYNKIFTRINLFHRSSPVHNRRVVSNDEIKYIEYLCFTVSQRKDNLSPRQDNYSEEQEELHSQIKKLHDKGYSYKRITKYLNAKGIKTPRGKNFGASGNSVHSILKKYKIRQERLKKVNREYIEVWSDMEIKWEKNNT